MNYYFWIGIIFLIVGIILLIYELKENIEETTLIIKIRTYLGIIMSILFGIFLIIKFWK